MEEASKNNGVAEYSLNTGQTITIYNTAELMKQIRYWERKYNETIQNKSQTNILIIRDEDA